MSYSEAFRTVPQFFFKRGTEYDHLYHNHQSCILYKSLDQTKLQGEYYISSHVLTLVVKGKKVIRTSADQKIVVNAGEMVFIPKDLYLIQDFIQLDAAFESWLFFFSDALINDFINSWQKNKINGFHIDKESGFKLPVYSLEDRQSYFMEGLIPLFSSLGEKGRAMVDVKLTELLHLMALGNSGADFIKQLHTLRRSKRNIKAFMEAHFDKPLKVEDYAYLTGRSLTTFVRDFKKYFKTTPKQWLMQKRMDLAKEKLQGPRATITQVAPSLIHI